MSERVLIIGATSAIAEEVARIFAGEGARLCLLGRNQDRLQQVADDLRVRGAAAVFTGHFNAETISDYEALIEEVWSIYGGLDTVLIAHGSLPDQAACMGSSKSTLRELHINGLSVIGFLTPLANRMEALGQGTLAVIASVAGDRGRMSNYVYGSAKALVETFLEGLGHRLHESGVRVVTIKPGFVDTPMTADFQKGALWARADQVALDIRKAILKGTPVVYTPWFWRWIMLVVCALPRPVFVRTRL